MDERAPMDDHARRPAARPKRDWRHRRRLAVRRSYGNPPWSWFRMMRNGLSKLFPWWPDHTLTVVDLNSPGLSPEIFFAIYGLNKPMGWRAGMRERLLERLRRLRTLRP